MTFPCLEELVVDQLHNQVKHLWKFPSSFPRLRKLVLGTIPFLVSLNISCLYLRRFEGHKFLFSTSASTENGAFVWTYSQLPKLEELSVERCDLLERVFENEDNSTPAIVKFCGQIKRLSLSSVYNLEHIPLCLFKSLVSLQLGFFGWKYVFSADMLIKGSELLPLLEDVLIKCSWTMEVVIEDKIRGDAKDRVVSFPRLKSLVLGSLAKAINLSSRPDVTILLPSLETLEVFNCEELEAFWSGSFVAPKLREVRLGYCKKMQWFLNGSSDQQVFLQSLQHVEILSCQKMQGFLTGYRNPGEVLELPSLRQVEYGRSPNMQSFYSGALKAPKLARVTIDEQEYSINHFLAIRYKREGNYEEGSSEKQSEGEIQEENSEV